ncbi:patatin-like phospholipase family protein [Streptomyces sp. NPDC001817]|uniref:patatin-like phospholipase family protein n=1 Tax=Streptomyces sp. NPDC001817 TaxID=3154398 RepID=UPI00331762D6
MTPGRVKPLLWDATAGVPLVRAIAASSASPGVEPPVAGDGRRSLDGALRDDTGIDLAAGTRTVVVIDPLAHRHPHPTNEGAHLVAPAAAVLLLDAEQGDPEAGTAA